MGWCHVGPDGGAKAVADLLMFNNTISVLDLRGNGLGNAGAAHLARSLKEHTNDKLTELDLGYNEIKDEGACTLAQVEKCTSLFTLKCTRVQRKMEIRKGKALSDSLCFLRLTNICQGGARPATSTEGLECRSPSFIRKPA